MTEGKYKQKRIDGSVECTGIVFGASSKWDAPKACFCEQEAKPKARRCAVEGDDCQCNNGNVFIGKLEVNGTEPATFEQLFTVPYAMKKNV